MSSTIEYTIKFVPENYYVQSMGGTEGVPIYFVVIGAISRRPVAFAYDENTAKTICLALELVRSQVYGETAKARSILNLIDKFRDMPTKSLEG